MADAAEETTEDTGAAAPSAAPAAAPAPAGPDFTSLVRPPSDMAAVQGKLSEIQRQKTAANAANADETIKRLETDRARMETAYKASAVMPDELKQPWDSNAERAKYSTDPVQAFGSIGSVFAMLATSFAGLPMEHALNAGAAAINAVHAGDEKAYQSAYDAWQKNTNLAIKRHEIQRQAYNDAINLMNTNINAGRTKMELAATKFGDQKAQALLDAGMDKELFELFDSRNKAALNLQSEWDKVQLQHEKIADLRADPRYSSQNIAEKQQAIQDWQRRWSAQGAMKLKYDFKQDYIENQKRSNPNYTPEDLLKWGQEADASEGAGDISTTGKLKTAAIKEIFEKAAAEGKPITMAEATRQYNLTTSTPSGNRVDDLRGKIDQANNIIAGAEKNLEFLRSYKGAAGLIGKIMRGEEIAENIANISDKSDRAQFRRRVLELQEMAPRIMTDSNGRPLKAAQDKIDGIVAGLNSGDTGPNTIRAYEELVADMKKRISDYQNRMNGGGQPAGGSGVAAPPPAAAGKNKTPWLNDPIVKPTGAGPRADIEEEQPAYG